VQRPGCFARGVIAVRGPGMATPTRPGPQVMIISPGWVAPAHGRGRSPFGGRVWSETGSPWHRARGYTEGVRVVTPGDHGVG